MQPQKPNSTQQPGRFHPRRRDDQKFHDDVHSRSLPANSSTATSSQSRTVPPRIPNMPPTSQASRSARSSTAGATAGDGKDVAKDTISSPKSSQDPGVAAMFGRSPRNVTNFAGGAATNNPYASAGQRGPSSSRYDADTYAYYQRQQALRNQQQKPK